MAARITPINAPQTKSELPNIGASSRLPRISRAITTAPVMNAVTNSHGRDHCALPDGAVIRQGRRGERVEYGGGSMEGTDGVRAFPNS